MTNSPFENNKQYAYEKAFRSNFEHTDSEITSKYAQNLKEYFDFHNIPEEDRDYTLPDAVFIDAFKRELTEHLSFIKELFSQGECLITTPCGIYEDELAYIYTKQREINGKSKLLAYSSTKFPLCSNLEIALFSNGRFLVSEYVADKALEEFAKLATKNGYILQKQEDISSLLLERIKIYAKKIYKDKLIEIDISDEKKFINNLFADDNKCLTASDEFVKKQEAREYLALFSDGRLVVAEEYEKRPINDYIKAFKRTFFKHFVIFQEEYVPYSYIKNIYKKAAEFDWYVSKKENRPQSNKSTHSIDKYFENGNQCLLREDCDIMTGEKEDQFAFFSDGLLLINEGTKYNGDVLNFEVIAKRKWPELTIRKELVPLNVLQYIYEKARKNSTSAKSLYLEMLKKRAKILGNEENIPHHEALEQIAKFAGFKNWKDACEISEKLGVMYLSEEKQRRGFLAIFDKHAAREVDENCLQLSEAREVIAKRRNFKSWRQMYNSSIKQIEDAMFSTK